MYDRLPNGAGLYMCPPAQHRDAHILGAGHGILQLSGFITIKTRLVFLRKILADVMSSTANLPSEYRLLPFGT